MGCVYLATNQVNSKQYVGQTIHTLKQRRKVHLADARRKPKYRQAFHHAIAKYGPSKFKWKVLLRSNDPQTLLAAEVCFIAELGAKAPDGYNLTDGGEGMVGFTHSEESKCKMSRSGCKRYESEEEREKRRQGALKWSKDNPMSEEKREKCRQGALKQWAEMTDKAREKLRQGQRKPCSEETKEKVRRAHLGKPLSEEHKEKLRQAKLGKSRGPRSEGTKEKIRQGHLRYWARQREHTHKGREASYNEPR